MKKYFIVPFIALVLCLFSACTPQSSPRQVAKTFWSDIQQEKYEEAIALYYNIDELFSEDGKQMLTTLMEMQMASYGKISKVRVLSVDKTDNPDKRVVSVEISSESQSEPFVETMDVVKSDGKWYIDFSI